MYRTFSLRSLVNAVLATAFLGCFAAFSYGQSTNQDYPTPVSASEISGVIGARDVGDPRLTAHFYAVEAGTGDLFINILTRNFTGDIDVFTLNSLQPLAKVVVYADFPEHETGRVIYLRKPEKLLLRIQGRTPGDEAATYRIKFAGSFIASNTEGDQQPELPKVTAAEEGPVRVNSVGTIIERPKPRATPPKAETRSEERAKAIEEKPAETPRNTETARSDIDKEDDRDRRKIEVVVTDKVAENERAATLSPAAEPPAEKARSRSASPRRSAARAKTGRRTPARRDESVGKTEASEPAKVDPLASIFLVVSFKDGSRIERPMSDVLRFTVDKGVLTVIAKDGSIGRYSLLDVAKVTIE